MIQNENDVIETFNTYKWWKWTFKPLTGIKTYVFWDEWHICWTIPLWRSFLKLHYINIVNIKILCFSSDTKMKTRHPGPCTTKEGRRWTGRPWIETRMDILAGRTPLWRKVVCTAIPKIKVKWYSHGGDAHVQEEHLSTFPVMQVIFQL